MNYIIFDLEATCWENMRPGYIQEIIEIGAFKVDPYAEVIESFCKFVKPIHHPTLSPFCRELTSITQENVDKAEEFPEVIEEFQEWIGLFDDDDYLLCSWGFFDRKALRHDCMIHDLEEEWVEKHISLKHQYKEIRNLRKPMGLKRAVETEGFEFDGLHHRGIDDARNLAKIFIKHFDNWKH